MKKNNLKNLFGLALVASAFVAAPSMAQSVTDFNPDSDKIPVIKGGDTSLLSSVDPSSKVGLIAPTDNAGLLNYCVQNEYVDPDQGMTDLRAYNQKTGAVVENETGNIPYAEGSSGLLRAGGQTYNVALSTLPVRKNTCAAVYKRAKAELAKASKTTAAPKTAAKGA